MELNPRFRGALFAVSLFCITPGAIAVESEARGYGLADALADAIAHDPRVDLARSEEAAAATDVDIARGGYYPAVSAQAGVGDLAGETEYQLNVRQVVYDWGRVSSQVDASEAEREVSRHNRRLTRSTVAFDTADAYLSYIQSRDVAAVYGEYMVELDNLVGIAERRTAGRFSSRVETDRAQLEKARALEVRQRYLGWMAAARQDFIEFTGRDPGLLALASPPALPVVAVYGDAPEMLDQRIQSAPRVKTELARVDKARADLDLSRAQRWPQLNVEADWVRREFNEDVDTDVVVALRLRSDTYLGLSNFRRPEAARHRLEAQDYEVHASRREIRRSLQQLVAVEPALEARLDALAAQLTNSGEIAEVYRKQFLAGLRDFDDLLTVIRDRYDARRQQVEIRTELLRQQYQVAADFGMLARLVSGGGEGNSHD